MESYVYTYKGEVYRCAILQPFIILADTNVVKPSSVSDNWRSATSIAAQSLSTESLQATCDSLCEIVELAFSEFASSKKEGRVRKLRQLVEQSIKFKQHLDRQDNCYFFFSTSPSEKCNVHQMQCIAVSQDECLCAQLSLWPGLAKCARVRHFLWTREVVWTSETPNEAQSSASSLIISAQEVSEADEVHSDEETALSCSHDVSDEAMPLLIGR